MTSPASPFARSNRAWTASVAKTFNHQNVASIRVHVSLPRGRMKYRPSLPFSYVRSQASRSKQFSGRFETKSQAYRRWGRSSEADSEVATFKQLRAAKERLHGTYVHIYKKPEIHRR